jgi:hypothetical protein
MESIYDGQADRAIWEFCDLAPRARDPTSESLEPIQSARAEDNLRAAFRKHDRSRLAYSTTRAGDDDDLAFDSRHEVFTFCFLFSQLGTL